jgi:hypothetical protein
MKVSSLDRGRTCAAAAGRLDDHMHVAVFREGGQLNLSRFSLETMAGRLAIRRRLVRPVDGKRPSRRLRVLVDLTLGELRQRLAGFLFLGKRRLQQLYGLVHSESVAQVFSIP